MLKSNIKGYIELSPYSREELMELLQVSRNTISAWSSGKSYPPLEKAFYLSRLLGVTVEDLYTYEPSEKTGNSGL